MEKNVLQMLQDENRFEKLPDGWIKDKAMGLDWGPSSSEEMNAEAAREYAEKGGGRLPERVELELLVDVTKHDPAINPIFSDAKSSWYWTSTLVSGFASCAWCVGFGYGGVGSCPQDGTGYVRPVRASQ